MNLFNITFIFVVDDVAEHNAIKKNFTNIDVKIYKCDISQIKPVDCVICPGNSYGIITNKHASTINKLLGLEQGIKNAINNIYYGEQPVGSCMLINTKNLHYKHMGYVPINRIPFTSVPSKQTKQKNNTDKKNTENTENKYNVYYAFRALLTSILNYNKTHQNKITTVTCPILYSDYENKDPETSANQMRLAYSMIDMNPDCSIKTANIRYNSTPLQPVPTHTTAVSLISSRARQLFT